MKYSDKFKINEIFYSLQGEGAHAGHAAVFVRFSGCNLRCPFCDTDHIGGAQMTLEEIVEEVGNYPAHLVVLTGGEPSLFVTDELIEALHKAGKFVAIETNGTNRVPDAIDWVTCSPKIGMAEGADRIRLQRADEIKVVNVGQDLEQYFHLPGLAPCRNMYLQPCYVADEEARLHNMEDTVAKVKADPRWRLSAQLHRFLSIP